MGSHLGDPFFHDPAALKAFFRAAKSVDPVLSSRLCPAGNRVGGEAFLLMKRGFHHEPRRISRLRTQRRKSGGKKNGQYCDDPRHAGKLMLRKRWSKKNQRRI